MLLKTASIARSFRVIIEFNMSTTLNSVATIPRKDQCLIAFSVNFTFVSQHLIYSVWNFWWLCSKSRIYSFNLYSSLFQWNHFATANLTCRQNSEHTKVVRSKVLYIPRIINWSPDASSENISVHFFRYRAKTSISLFNAFLFHFFSSYDVQKFWFVFQDGKHAHGVRAIEIENSLKNMARIESSKFQNLRKKKSFKFAKRFLSRLVILSKIWIFEPYCLFKCILFCCLLTSLWLGFILRTLSLLIPKFTREFWIFSKLFLVCLDKMLAGHCKRAFF